MQATKKGWWFLDALFAGQLLCRAGHGNSFITWFKWARLKTKHNPRVLHIRNSKNIGTRDMWATETYFWRKIARTANVQHISLAAASQQSVTVLCWGYSVLSADKAAFFSWKSCMVWCPMCSTRAGLGTFQPWAAVWKEAGNGGEELHNLRIWCWT